MRYSPDHKDLTRQRIIDTASLLFKERGIDATGIALVMSTAELTNGAFYAHFTSKEALVEAVITDQVDKQIEEFAEFPHTIEGVKTIVAAYLSQKHRDNCAAGCPSAALLDEIGRRSETTKEAYSANMLRLVDSFQDHFSDLDTEQTRSLVFSLLGLLIGTLQLARAMTNGEVSDTILESGQTAALRLIETR